MDENLMDKWKNEEKMVFSGWDFSHLEGRYFPEKPPWDYRLLAKNLLKKSNSVLDIGTGGGEFFSSLGPLPRRAVATEAFKPNVSVAKKKLEPLGIKLVELDEKAKMPFLNEEFDLVLNRHSYFNAKEVFRVLKKKGVFLTQQVGGGDDLKDLVKEFDVVRGYETWTYEKAKEMVNEAGFNISKSEKWYGKLRFKDVGALVYYLKAIPWIVPDFSVEKKLAVLKKLQNRLEKEGELVFTQSRFVIIAKKE